MIRSGGIPGVERAGERLQMGPGADQEAGMGGMARAGGRDLVFIVVLPRLSSFSGSGRMGSGWIWGRWG